jgi:hypothetical protein
MTKPIGAFRNFANSPKNNYKSVTQLNCRDIGSKIIAWLKPDSRNKSKLIRIIFVPRL